MPTATKTARTCEKGHTYFKSSDCPTCPVCEAEKKPAKGVLSLLSAPARRALEREGITTLEQLSGKKETEILQLHGIGPGSIPALRKALQEKGLGFKK